MQVHITPYLYRGCSPLEYVAGAKPREAGGLFYCWDRGGEDGAVANAQGLSHYRYTLAEQCDIVIKLVFPCVVRNVRNKSVTLDHVMLHDVPRCR